MQIYSEHTPDDHASINKALKACDRKYKDIRKGKGKKRAERSQLIVDLVGKLTEVLDTFTSTTAEGSDEQECLPIADKSFMSMPAAAERLPAGARGLPEWASAGAINGRGILPISKAHYTALCSINGAFCEAVIDTGGARSMIDYNTALALKLDIELASGSQSFGSFWGPSSEPISYFGRVRGPV